MIIVDCKEAPRVQLTAREIKEMFSTIDGYYSMLIKMATELSKKTGDDRYMYFANLMRIYRDSIKYSDVAKGVDVK